MKGPNPHLEHRLKGPLGHPGSDPPKGVKKGVQNDQNVRCFGHPLQKAYRLLPPTLAKPKKGVFFGHFGMFWPFWPGVPKGSNMG